MEKSGWKNEVIKQKNEVVNQISGTEKQNDYNEELHWPKLIMEMMRTGKV